MKRPKLPRIHPVMKRKLMITFGLVMLAFCVLIAALTYINVKKGKEYAKIVLSQQSYDSKTIPYKRGDILDTNGTILATSTKVYNVILDSKVLNSDEENIEPTVDALCECFEDLSKEELLDFISDKPTNQYHVLLEKQSYEAIEKFVTMDNDDENYPNIAGVWFEEEYVRQYPYPTLAASVVGFVTNDGTGLIGLESSYNSILTGVNGREYGYFNSDSNMETTIIDAKDGETIVSTIDMNIQTIVEKQIKSFNKKYENNYRAGEDGSKNTACVVMDPNTGEILAMANYPSFDLSDPRDLTGRRNIEHG